jgi:hypothetical protein
MLSLAHTLLRFDTFTGIVTISAVVALIFVSGLAAATIPAVVLFF